MSRRTQRRPRCSARRLTSGTPVGVWHARRVSSSATEPFEVGHLDVGDGHMVYWERVGRRGGKPAVVLHGGPGSGATAWWRTFFDPERYDVTLFDQRGCGRSRPLASDDETDLSTITTAALISDIEALRVLQGAEQWLVFGGSWGSTLGLAYAVEHPARVSELVLWGVTTTTQAEVDWLTWTMGEIYPEAFAELRALVPGVAQGGNLPAAYQRLLADADPAVRDTAAQAWCAWEDRLATLSGEPVPSERFQDPAFRLGFARLVTYFFANHGFLAPGAIHDRLERIAHIPAVFVRGRLDIASPLGPAWRMAQHLPLCELRVLESEGHGGEPGTNELLVAALDRFAGG